MHSDDKPKIIEGTWSPADEKQAEARLVRNADIGLFIILETSARNLEAWLNMMGFKDETPYTTPWLIVRHLKEEAEKCRS